MKKGDRVIIEGPNGYEIGVVTYDSLMFNQYQVEIRSGHLYAVKALFDIADLEPYDEIEIDKLKVIHGYEKRFAKEF